MIETCQAGGDCTTNWPGRKAKIALAMMPAEEPLETQFRALSTSSYSAVLIDPASRMLTLRND
jgi:hypothetical protein